MKKKSELKRDTVESDKFHVGIELELTIERSGDGSHDDDACQQSYRDNIENESTRSLLQNYLGMSMNSAIEVEDFVDREQLINHICDGYDCDYSDCSFNNIDNAREDLQSELINMTGNRSFKVVEDGSINTNSDDRTDAEVCWNYFASKETLKDNEKILKHLKSIGAEFDKSCGLHINLNNYLEIPAYEVETEKLEPLFNFVAPSRRRNEFCSRMGIGVNQKYSMIYHQRDRLEFRFFSPTLEVDKLNHYVTLANVVYNRLAGKDKKLPKKTADYFYNKMTTVNGLDPAIAKMSIEFVNKMKSIRSLSLTRLTEVESDESIHPANPVTESEAA